MEVQVNKEIKEYRSHLKTYYKANMNNYPALEEKYNVLNEAFNELEKDFGVNMEKEVLRTLSQSKTVKTAKDVLSSSLNA